MFQDPQQKQFQSGQQPMMDAGGNQNPYGIPPTPYSPPQASYPMPLHPFGSPPTASSSYPAPDTPAYQQSFVPGSPQAQPPPLPLDQALADLPRRYLKVFTKPSTATLSQEMGGASWGSVWVQLLVFAFFSGLLVALLGLLDLAVRGTTLSTFQLFAGALTLAFLTFVLVVVLFFLHTGLFYLFARRAGGQGTFLAHSSTTLLFLVPSGIIVEVLMLLSMLIPLLGWLLLLTWLIYSIVLDILVIEVVHGLSGGKAAAVVLIPPGVVLVLAGVSVPALAGEAHADIYELLGSIVGLFAVAFLFTILILSWVRGAAGSKQPGRRIVATVTRVDWQPPVGISAGNPSQGSYIVTAVWTDPQSGRVYTFWQRFDRPPRCRQGGPVSIVLDSSNPGRYSMEL
ncbi:MAG TPA: YIP1 family protein [Ktedonobacteraceae bacterium]|nr:YIP1 family protein [Ktedonobacteraceae bacterium]